MSDIYSDSVYVQIKLLCKKRFPSPLTVYKFARDSHIKHARNESFSFWVDEAWTQTGELLSPSPPEFRTPLPLQIQIPGTAAVLDRPMIILCLGAASFLFTRNVFSSVRYRVVQKNKLLCFCHNGISYLLYFQNSFSEFAMKCSLSHYTTNALLTLRYIDVNFLITNTLQSSVMKHLSCCGISELFLLTSLCCRLSGLQIMVNVDKLRSYKTSWLIFFEPPITVFTMFTVLFWLPFSVFILQC